MTLAPMEPVRRPRPELSLDPITAGLVMMLIALWRVRRQVTSERRDLRFAVTAALGALSQTCEERDALAGERHEAQVGLQTLIRERHEAQVGLQTLIPDLIDREAEFWADPPENGPLSDTLAAREDPPKGIDPDSRSPGEEVSVGLCENCPNRALGVCYLGCKERQS